ncbi:MAG TPA: hypothetical protein V6C95_07915 [Coleofasciculaceae cyanobacterium]
MVRDSGADAFDLATADFKAQQQGSVSVAGQNFEQAVRSFSAIACRLIATIDWCQC